MKQLLLILALALGLSVSTKATIFYVSTSGNDSNAGTSSAFPVLTINTGVGKAGSGDTVIVEDGTYLVFAPIVIDKPLTLLGQGQPDVDGVSWSGGLSKRLLVIANTSDVFVDGFKFKNLIGDYSVGVLIEGSGRNITLQHCQITNIGWTSGPSSLSAIPSGSNNANGILLHGTSATALSRINVIYDTITNCALGFSEALTVAGNVDTFEVSHNFVAANSNIGIDISGHNDFAINPPASVNYARNGRIAQNIVFRSMSPVKFSAGIYLDGASDCVVDGNRLYENAVGLSVGCERTPSGGAPGCSRNKIINNIIYDNAAAGVFWGDTSSGAARVVNNMFLNNTLFKNRTGDTINGIGRIGTTDSAGTLLNGQWGSVFGGELHLQRNDSSLFQNNIFFPWGARRCVEVLPPFHTTKALFAYNNFYKEAPGTDIFEMPPPASVNGIDTPHIYSINCLGIDTNSINAYPQFVDTANENFKLVSGSPCVDAGDPATTIATAGSLDYYGQPRVFPGRIDIGAAESQTLTLIGADRNNIKNDYIKLFPNPADGTIYFNSTRVIALIRIHDATGRLIRSIGQPTSPILLGNLNSGLYLIQFLDEHGEQTTQPFIVR